MNEQEIMRLRFRITLMANHLNTYICLNSFPVDYALVGALRLIAAEYKLILDNKITIEDIEKYTPKFIESAQLELDFILDELKVGRD